MAAFLHLAEFAGLISPIGMLHGVSNMIINGTWVQRPIGVTTLNQAAMIAFPMTSDNSRQNSTGVNGNGD